MSHAAVPVLLEAALRALLLACVLGACLRLLRVRNVPAQKAVWGLVLMAAVAMPLLMRRQWLPEWVEVKLPAPAWMRMASATPRPTQMPVPSAADAWNQPAQMEPGRIPARAVSIVPFDTPSTAVRAAAPENPPADSSVTGAAATAPAAGRASLRPLAAAWLLYLGMTAALLLRLLLGLGSAITLWVEAKPVEAARDGEWPGNVAVRSSRRVGSPVNIGSGILLPADYAHWDEEKLRVVLAHEASHVHQRDFYLQLLAGLYAAFTWFSPLGWWLKRKLSELGEAISDRAGLEASASPSAYAQLLLEFAALPRPTVIGVAMAHSTHLSHRIERLLNDSSFRQAFAGRGRALLALALAPVALVAATALVRVQAAETVADQAAASQSAASQSVAGQAAQSPDQAAGQGARTGQSHPDDAQVTNQDAGQDSSQAAPTAPQPNPAAAAVPAPQAPDAAQAPPPPPAPPAPAVDAAPTAAPAPPAPQAPVPPPADLAPPEPPVAPASGFTFNDRAFKYRYEGGDPYAIVGDPGTRVRYSGDWDDDRRAEIDKARSAAHGHFLWFRHDGKSYIVDDPGIVSQVEAMDKQMEDVGTQMREMGRQMRDAGQQAREAARKAREASRSITVPDLSKEMADLNAAMAGLQAKTGTTVSREQLAEIQRKLAEVQRKLMNVQIKVDINWDGDMGKFGQAQGEFGAKMGQLGAEMGRIAQENNEKIRSIIDDSLKNGKARPVD